MCGIAGIIGKSDEVVGLKMLSKIRHRGPDGEGVWSSPAGEYPTTLCHARLAILDLTETGAQPFFTKDQRYVIVFNGEIYNYIELRSYLEAAYGINFISTSDTEIILEGLVREGVDFLHKCNGMWALCLWDRVAQSAFLARDRFGVKPLFYSELGDGVLAFSSEMKGLSILLEKIEPSPWIDTLFKNQFEYEATEYCAINQIKRLPLGSYAICGKDNIKVRRWWNTLDHLLQVDSSYDSQVSHWRDLFLDSTALRMRSDVRIGTALSGGLDSSSVLAAMAQVAKSYPSRHCGLDDWRSAVCCFYSGSELDESKWAEMAARQFNVSFSLVDVNPIDSFFAIESSLAQVEDPYLTMPLPMLATYKAIKNKGISVTLDGHGADELFSGYGHLKVAYSCARSRKELIEIIAIEESTRTGVYSPRQRRMIREQVKTYFLRFLSKYKIYPSSVLRSLRNNYESSDCFDPVLASASTLKAQVRNHNAFASMDSFSQVLYEIFHLSILPTLLRNYDRYSMANALEIRMPFMDWRLVCYTFSLPWRSKIGGTFTKRIQRDAMLGLLSDPIRLRRDKIGWNAPIHEWLRGPLKSTIQTLLADTSESPYTSRSKAGIHEFMAKKNPTFHDGQKVWNSIMPALWVESLSSSEVWR
jgi:asparagine synthase (glutamine-hydrolysing)